MKGKVVWKSDKDKNGVILGDDKIEYYFDKSTMSVNLFKRLKGKLRVSFRPKKIGSVKVANDIKVIVKKVISDKKLETENVKERVIKTIADFYFKSCFAQDVNGHGMFGFARAYEHSHYFPKITWKIGGKKEPQSDALYKSLTKEVERRLIEEYDFQKSVTSYYLSVNARAIESSFESIKSVLTDEQTIKELEENSENPKINILFQRAKDIQCLELENEIFEAFPEILGMNKIKEKV